MTMSYTIITDEYEGFADCVAPSPLLALTKLTITIKVSDAKS